MKIPKSIRIGGEKWTIHQFNDPNNDGLTDPENRKIMYNPKGDVMITLLHELKHVMQLKSGMGLVLSSEMMEIDAETTAIFLMEIFDLKFKK